MVVLNYNDQNNHFVTTKNYIRKFFFLSYRAYTIQSSIVIVDLPRSILFWTDTTFRQVKTPCISAYRLSDVYAPPFHERKKTNTPHKQAITSNHLSPRGFRHSRNLNLASPMSDFHRRDWSSICYRVPYPCSGCCDAVWLWRPAPTQRLSCAVAGPSLRVQVESGEGFGASVWRCRLTIDLGHELESCWRRWWTGYCFVSAASLGWHVSVGRCLARSQGADEGRARRWMAAPMTSG